MAVAGGFARAGRLPFVDDQEIAMTTRTAVHSRYSSAVVNANGTSNVVIAGVAGKTIRVHGFDITLASAQALTIKDGTTPLTGPMTLQTYQKPKDPDPHFETSSGNDLHFDLGVGAQMSGIIWYVQS